MNNKDISLQIITYIWVIFQKVNFTFHSSSKRTSKILGNYARQSTLPNLFISILKICFPSWIVILHYSNCYGKNYLFVWKRKKIMKWKFLPYKNLIKSKFFFSSFQDEKNQLLISNIWLKLVSYKIKVIFTTRITCTLFFLI